MASQCERFYHVCTQRYIVYLMTIWCERLRHLCTQRCTVYGPYKYSVSTFGCVLPKTLKTDYRGYLLPTHPIGWDVEKSGGFGGCATPTADTHDDRKVVSIQRVEGDQRWEPLAYPANPSPCNYD